jgi:putative SbcD/Mre11-related phosphoesterase
MTPTFRDRAVLIEETLVVADLHLGRAETSAVEAPVSDGQDVCGRLASLSAALDPETVVLAGDVLHAFESVPRGVAETLSEIDRRIGADAEIVVVTGNHDTMLDQVWEGETTDSHWIDAETLVVHGHELPAAEAKRYVLGHDHPTIEIEGQRHPCFLRGAGGPDGSTVLVLPAFNRFTAGVVINHLRAEEFQSPLVVDTDVLEPIVRDTAGETLRFPRLGAFRDRLPGQ